MCDTKAGYDSIWAALALSEGYVLRALMVCDVPRFYMSELLMHIKA